MMIHTITNPTAATNEELCKQQHATSNYCLSDFDVESAVDAMLKASSADAIARADLGHDCCSSGTTATTSIQPQKQYDTTTNHHIAHLMALQKRMNEAFEQRLAEEIHKMKILEQAQQQRLLEERRCDSVKRNNHTVPLISKMNDDLWSKLSEFLSDYDYLALEDAVMNLVPRRSLAMRWNARRDPPRFRSGMSQHRQGKRIVRFEEASAYARQMEESERLHYNPEAYPREGDYEWPDKFYTRDEFCRDYQKYWEQTSARCCKRKSGEANNPGGAVGVPDVEFFVRMTFEEDDGSRTVLMEGFRPPIVAADQDPKGNYTTMGFGRDKAWMSMRFSGAGTYLSKLAGFLSKTHEDTQNSTSSDGCSSPDVWSGEARSLFLDRLGITVLACPMTESSDDHPSPLLSPKLILSTHGYDAPSNYDTGRLTSRSLVGFLKDRPSQAHIRNLGDYNLDSYVSVGYYSHDHSSETFAIYLKWGCYFA